MSNYTLCSLNRYHHKKKKSIKNKIHHSQKKKKKIVFLGKMLEGKKKNTWMFPEKLPESPSNLHPQLHVQP